MQPCTCVHDKMSCKCLPNFTLSTSLLHGAQSHQSKTSQKFIQISYSNLKQTRNNFRHGITMIDNINYLPIY